MKITRIPALVLALAVCLLQGCAQPIKVAAVEPGIGLPAAPPKGGYVALMQSYAVSDEWIADVSSMFFRLKRVEGGEYDLPIPLGRQDGMDTPEARAAYPRNAKIVAGFLVAELPPGEYEFSRFWARATVPARRPLSGREYQMPVSVYNPAEPLSTRFRIEAGRTTYLGEAFIFMGFRRYGASFVDRRKRDLPLLSQRYPQIDQKRLDVRIPMRVPRVPDVDTTAPMQYNTH